MIRLPADAGSIARKEPGGAEMATKKKKAKTAKTPRKARKTAGRSKPKPTRGARKAARTGRPRASVRSRTKVRKSAKTTPKKAAAPARKTSSLAASKPASAKVAKPKARTAAPSTPSGGLTPFPSPGASGEGYGEEVWKEEELSASELDADAPELDELEAEGELEGPDLGEDSDDSEW